MGINLVARECADSMLDLPQLGELIRGSMSRVGWKVVETAMHLGCEHDADQAELSNLLSYSGSG